MTATRFTLLLDCVHHGALRLLARSVPNSRRQFGSCLNLIISVDLASTNWLDYQGASQVLGLPAASLRLWRVRRLHLIQIQSTGGTAQQHLVGAVSDWGRLLATMPVMLLPDDHIPFVILLFINFAEASGAAHFHASTHLGRTSTS